MPLALEEKQAIQRQVSAVEARTGAQILVALVGKSDAYPEVPWKAFALGAALGAASVVLDGFLQAAGGAGPTPLTASLVALGAGTSLAVLTVFMRPFARWFVDRERTEEEVRQYARGLFLEHELFRTRQRIAMLLLASEFERSLVLLPDSGVRRRVSDGELTTIIDAMKPALAKGKTYDAFCTGLTAIEQLLVAKGFTPDGHNEITESLLLEQGK